METTFETTFSGSTATVHEGKSASTEFYFRLVTFSKEKKVQIPTYLFDTRNDWNAQALALVSAMLDRTSGGYWMELLAKYREGEPRDIIEQGTASEEEKNTLRVMAMMMAKDKTNDGKIDDFIVSYLNHGPATGLPEDLMEALYDECYLNIID